MKWGDLFGCCLKKFPSDEGQKSRAPPPTAVQRAQAACRALKEGKQLMIPSLQDPQAIQFVICPELAKRLLKYEETLSSDDDSHSDASYENDETTGRPACIVTTDNKNKNNNKVRLDKPSKPTLLLQHALTNQNSSNWRRQRRILQRAFAKSKPVRRLAAQFAVGEVKRYFHFHFAQNSNDNDDSSTHKMKRRIVVLDVRTFALDVSLATICFATFGKEHYKEILDKLKPIYLPSLRAIRRGEGDPTLATNLKSAVTKALMGISSNMEANTEDQECLAYYFLQCEAGIDDSSSKLTRDEVISNCHSALLAGTQTMCTTLAMAILHLADRNTMKNQQQSSSSSSSDDETRNKVQLPSSKSILLETLRILPPVASLPRCPVGEGGLKVDIIRHHHTDDDDDDILSRTNLVREHSIVVMDTLAMAHAQHDSNFHQGEDTSCGSSWKFDPSQRSSSMGNAAPWGMGARKCPAGILSLDCLKAVLDYLRDDDDDNTILWRLQDPLKDGAGTSGTGGWVSLVQYTPTLTFPEPILVEFSHHGRKAY